MGLPCVEASAAIAHCWDCEGGMRVVYSARLRVGWMGIQFQGS